MHVMNWNKVSVKHFILSVWESVFFLDKEVKSYKILRDSMFSERQNNCVKVIEFSITLTQFKCIQTTNFYEDFEDY